MAAGFFRFFPVLQGFGPLSGKLNDFSAVKPVFFFIPLC